jgi:hypothetical protein
MRLTSKLTASLFALALTVGLSAQANAAEKGTIKGKVTGVDGNAAKNLEVRVMPPMAGGPGGGAKKPAPAAVSATPAAKELADKPAGGGRAKPVATATTDKDGKFTVDVEAGEYTVMAGARGEAMGREKVTVEAGKTAEVNLTLKAPKAK